MFTEKFSAVKYILYLLVILLCSDCSEKSEAEKIGEYLLSINADETGAPGGTPPALQLPQTGGTGGNTTLVGGTPFQASEGFCGDGIINGENEHCDKQAMGHTSCRDLGGLAGILSCDENCDLNITDCITPAVDDRLGGIAETCKCNCDSTRCRGGCMSTDIASQSICNFQCDNDCICSCEGKLEAHVEECDIRCLCQVNNGGTPDCECSLDECEILAVIAPGIATKISTSGGGHAVR